MALSEHLAKLNEGSLAWNEWRVAPVNDRSFVRPLDLRAIHLCDQAFYKINLSCALLDGAKLSRCTFRNASFMNAALKGIQASQSDFTEADFTIANLTHSSFEDARLFGANLVGANLCKATLRGVDLSFANLMRADLRSADLTGTNLWAANLAGAILHQANLSSANLRETNFSQTDLTNAKIVSARFSNTIFGATTLKNVVGLEECVHLRPSHLDFQTLVQSSRLPLSFLRGCGLPEVLITYMPSLLNEPIQFYTCFISYSTKDQEFAVRLHADLQARGVRCWFAPHDMQGGLKLHEQIDEAIRVYQRLLLILSPASMESEWVKTEIAKARRRELQEKRRMLFPVRLVNFEALRTWECFDSDTGKDSAREIREFYVPDFSDWKNHDSYQVELQKLVRDLQISEIKNPL